MVVHRKTLEKVHKLFSDYRASPPKPLKVLSGKPVWEVTALIKDKHIQFFGGDDDVYTRKLLTHQTVFIDLAGMLIPCLSLEAEIHTYEATGRQEKADAIQEFLKNS